MARTTPRTTGDILREWRGAMKLDRAAVYASDRLGFDISSETVRRYETKYRVDQMDPLVIVALAGTYDRGLGELPDEAQKRIDKARDLLLSAKPWIAASPVREPAAA